MLLHADMNYPDMNYPSKLEQASGHPTQNVVKINFWGGEAKQSPPQIFCPKQATP